MQTNAGRFISQDPIRFASDQTNFFQFVDNHPQMETDPSGLSEKYRKQFLQELRKRGTLEAFLNLVDTMGVVSANKPL